MVLKKRIFFKISSMYFQYFVIISPWKRVGPLIWTTLNPLHPRMHCAKFGWNWPVVLEEKNFLILSMYFRFSFLSPLGKRHYLPFGKGVALSLIKLESPSPGDTSFQVWLNLAQWFWRRRWKCEKFTERWIDRQTAGRTDKQTDDGRQVIRKAHLSFQLRWA